MTKNSTPNDRYKHKHTISLYVNGEQLDMLNAFANKHRVTKSAVLRAMLSTLKNMTKEQSTALAERSGEFSRYQRHARRQKAESPEKLSQLLEPQDSSQTH